MTAAASGSASASNVRYSLRAVMLTSSSVERGSLTPSPPWRPDEIGKETAALNLALKATPSSSRISPKGDTYLVKLPLTAEYRILPKGKQPTDKDKVRLLIEVEYCGIFEADGSDKAISNFLATTAATMLFPYASQMIYDLMAKAGCTPMFLPPLDFAALKRQAAKQEEIDASATRQ